MRVDIKKPRPGLSYAVAVLREKPRTITRAIFWLISDNDKEPRIALKLGRYNKARHESGYFVPEDLETATPRSELTLELDEFEALVELLEGHYAPLMEHSTGLSRQASDIDSAEAASLRRLLEDPEFVGRMSEHDVRLDDLAWRLELAERRRAVVEFERMLTADLREPEWQEWFEANGWVFGTEQVRILGERRIDVSSVADCLVEAYDGFLDVVELKRPGGSLGFWSWDASHSNWFPHADLIKSITQALKYVVEIEREADSIEFLNRVGGVRVVKPRATLVYGRSADWGADKHSAFRLLNSSYHNLTVLTYDHVLERAKRMIAAPRVGTKTFDTGAK